MRRPGRTRVAALLTLVACAVPTLACSPDPAVSAERSRAGGPAATDPVDTGPTAQPDGSAPDASVPDSVKPVPTLPPLPDPTANPGDTDDTGHTDDTDASEPGGTGPETTAASDTEANADGVGDPLFPSLGNPGIDVQDYAVVLAYDPAADTIAGSVTLTIEITERRDEITLDSSGPEVDAVTIEGAPVEFAADDPELRITPDEPLDEGDRIVLEVEYHARPGQHGSTGILPSGWFDTEGGSYVLNEPDGARTWLPSNDHPSDKATWKFDLTVPSGTSAIANGTHVATEETPAGSRWVWRQDEPMATYLVLLLTGDYELVEGTGPGGLPLLSVVLREDRAEMQRYVDGIAEQIDFFDGWFGPYPLASYGIAMTDSVPGLAMETQGRSLFSRGDFSGVMGDVEQLLLSHELAHQWFGDAVSPATWKDIWLNESFATYGQWMWLEHQGLTTVDDSAAGALSARAMAGSSPTGDPSVMDMFGFNSYDGGAVVLHALRRTIGDASFFVLLQRWVNDNEGTSRTSADFIALAEEVAGQDLGEFFDTWLYSDDVPTTFPDAAA